MNVLFISSGNSSKFDIAPFIKSQGESLRESGIRIQYFTIRGKGFLGYLKAALKIRKYLIENPTDIIHAHYALSGWAAVLSFPGRPVILSLMGTDAYGEYCGVGKVKFSSRYLTMLTLLIQPFVTSIICKSKNIENFVYLKSKSIVIPNGIPLEKINNNDQGFKKKLRLNPEKKHILFLGNKKSKRKNFQLLKKAMDIINSNEILVEAPYPVSHEQVIKYLNSADALVVPSLMEGSPNVVKEAMACNCPVVATDVGDVAWLFGDEPGHFLTSFEPEDVADKIQMALAFAGQKGKTRGRARIKALGLDSETVARRIIRVYERALNCKKSR